MKYPLLLSILCICTILSESQVLTSNYIDIASFNISHNESLGSILVMGLKNVSYPFSLTLQDFIAGREHWFRACLSFCIKHELYYSHKNCPEFLCSQYVKIIFGANIEYDDEEKLRMRRANLDLEGSLSRLQGSMTTTLFASHTADLTSLSAQIEAAMLPISTGSIPSMLLRWDNMMQSKDGLQHFIDSQFCVHHFLNVGFLHKENENIFRETANSSTFGFVDSSLNFSDISIANCTGNVESFDTRLIQNGYWKNYKYGHYTRFLVSNTSFRVDDDRDGIFAIIQDYWYCYHFGKVYLSISSLF